MRRVLAACVAACGVVLVTWPWLYGPLTSYLTEHAQTSLVRQVPAPSPHAARAGPGRDLAAQPVPLGDVLALMRIPRFGRAWRWAVLQGVAPDVLADGPGHYPRTALPGARGNTAFAAHRAGHGDPFLEFDRLRPGDPILLSQGRLKWTYEVDTRPRIVPTSASWVLRPARGHRLTLTTCWPRYGSERRMYVRATLVGSHIDPRLRTAP